MTSGVTGLIVRILPSRGHRHKGSLWTARLLPWLEQESHWRAIGEAYQQDRDFTRVPPHHTRSLVVRAFVCSADGRVAAVGERGAAFTSYLGVEGTDQFTMDGMLFKDSHIRFVDVHDGTSNTLMVGERPPGTDGILGWWYAGWGQDQDGSAEMVLGVREINIGRYAQECPAGPYRYTAGHFNNQCDAFHFWSPHSGGSPFLFTDGSVRFLRYAADSVMPALATRAGGEVAQLPE